MPDGDKTKKNPPSTDPLARLVAERAAAMKADQQLSPDRTFTRMRLPGELDFPLTTKIVEHCLLSAFSITMPRAARAQLKLGVETEFEDHTIPELPPRKVRIVPAGEPGVCEVTGAAPEHGRDSRAVVKFNWRKRSGRIKPDGTIDWKDINSVPNVQEGDLLAEIHDRTTGRPGVDVYGRALKPKPGKRHPVRWMKGRIFSRRDEEANMYRLFAACSGVVRFEFRVPGDPATLQSLEIADRLTINGDIDYDYGDLKSAASLDIRGSLRGAFSLRSEGHVHVKGAIEGKEIEAENISAELITNGCRVYARKDVEAGSLANCEVTAGQVCVAMNASSSEIRARDRVVFKRDCAIMAVRIWANSVLLEQTVFSGRVEIRLGDEIFTQADAATARMREYETVFGKQAEETREAARDILSHCLGLEKTIRGFRPETVPARLFAKLREMLADAFSNMQPISDLVISIAYELQDVLGDHGLPRGALKKVDLVVTRIRNYNNLYLAFAERREMIERERRRLAELREMTGKLQAEFDQAVPMNANAEMRIRCGDSMLVIEGGEFPGGRFTVTYHLPDDAEDLRHGELRTAPYAKA